MKIQGYPGGLPPPAVVASPTKITQTTNTAGSESMYSVVLLWGLTPQPPLPGERGSRTIPSGHGLEICCKLAVVGIVG